MNSELKVFTPYNGDSTATYEKNGSFIQLIINKNDLMENIDINTWFQERFEQFNLFEFIDTMDNSKRDSEIIAFLKKISPTKVFFKRGELSIFINGNKVIFTGL